MCHFIFSKENKSSVCDVLKVCWKVKGKGKPSTKFTLTSALESTTAFSHIFCLRGSAILFQIQQIDKR